MISRVAMEKINAVEGIPPLTPEDWRLLDEIRDLPREERIRRIVAHIRNEARNG